LDLQLGLPSIFLQRRKEEGGRRKEEGGKEGRREGYLL
jgi:hypothetical protein